MNTRSIVYWFLAATSLLVAIHFLHQRGPANPSAGPQRILSSLRPLKISAIQVRPAGTNQLEIRAELKEGRWQLVSPIAYPAQSASIQKLLTYLQKLTPATVISAADLKGHARADEEYGFVSPQVTTIILEQEDLRFHLQAGRKTNPGDQVFLQVIGSEGAFVVDAELLNFIPRSVGIWRDTALVDFKAVPCDRISVTNNAKALELQRDPATRLWRIAWPTQARAYTSKIQEALATLEATPISDFITDDPKADLESFGLAPPRMELGFWQGTNPAAALSFGRERTVGTNTELFVRRPGQNTVFTLPAESVDFWRKASVNDLRDPHVLALTAVLGKVEVFGRENFSLQLQTNGQWNILPQDLPADPVLAKNFLEALLGLEIVQFVKDVVAEPDLPSHK